MNARLCSSSSSTSSGGTSSSTPPNTPTFRRSFSNHLHSHGIALGLSSFYLASDVTLVGTPVALNALGWKFYLVLIIPSGFYICLIYLLFSETRQRTLEEIGELFGDKVASHWYEASTEEREKIAQDALRLTESARLLDSDSHDLEYTNMLREKI
jgi:hypothetical protein